jgi:hypothetical protein
MAHSSERTSADLQREIDADRQRIEQRIGAIQERMSPGQLVDEVIAYAKNSGGSEYVSNLGRALTTNPLPVALMGVSLAWLMAKQGTSSQTSIATASAEEDCPLYVAQGSVRRMGPPEDIDGERYSHFTDDAGQRFKARTDESGHRAGHFIDATGKTYRGFVDATGKHISHITDEAGMALDTATGWASDTWRMMKTAVGTVGHTATSASGAASKAGSSLVDQSTRLNEAILTHLRDQPLVGGALAFAVGAAIGAALPHTDTEDQALGEVAEKAKEGVATQAMDLVDKGKETVTKSTALPSPLPPISTTPRRIALPLRSISRPNAAHKAGERRPEPGRRNYSLIWSI